MTDSNPTRARYAAHKQAFTDVLGDPFAYPEPLDGWYNIFKRRSVVGAAQTNFDEGHGTANPARPSQLDFFCDVENVIQEVLGDDKKLLQNFINTYIVGDIESDNVLRPDERNRLEQRIGKLFRAYRIVPVAKYFTALRRPAPGKKG